MSLLLQDVKGYVRTVTFSLCASQTASWLDAAPGGLEGCLQESDRERLKELLTNQSCSLGRATTTGGELKADLSIY